MPPPSDHPATLLNGWLGNDNRVHLVIEKAHSCWRRKKVYNCVCLCCSCCGCLSPLRLLIMLAGVSCCDTQQCWWFICNILRLGAFGTYWQVKDKRMWNRVFVELSCGKKRTLHLIWGRGRNYFGGNERVKVGKGEGGECFRWQGSISEPGRPRCYAPGTCQSASQRPML